MSEFSIVVDGKSDVFLNTDRLTLFVCTNGASYTGVSMYNKEVVVAARDVLNQYLESLEKQT